MDAIKAMSDEFLLGDELIDGQHRKMLAMLAKMQHLESSSEIRGMMMKLYILVREHFFDEEALMADRGYPQQEEHAQEHARVLAEMDRYSKMLFGDGLSLVEIKEKLKVDVVEHLVEQDMRLGAFLQGRGA